jgi:hypothetical protein
MAASKREREREAYIFAREQWQWSTVRLARLAAKALGEPDIGQAINTAEAHQLAGEVQLLDLLIEPIDKGE